MAPKLIVNHRRNILIVVHSLARIPYYRIAPLPPLLYTVPYFTPEIIIIRH